MTTATGNICDALEVHGATIGSNEIDNRPLPEPSTIETAITCLFEPITGLFEDSPLVQDLQSTLWGVVNTFHAQLNRIDRELEDNERTQARHRDKHDGSEINDTVLKDAIDQGIALIDRKRAFLDMFDAAIREFEALTGSKWQTRYGSRQKTQHLTAAMIDSRDFTRARRQQWNEDHLPAGPYVVVSGGQEFQDIDAIWAYLDRVKAKHERFVLLHGGNKGVDTIAANWADNRGMTQIRYGLHKRNASDRAAAFRRNEKMLGEMPLGVVTFPGNGVTKALIREARKMGIPVLDYEERQAKCGTSVDQSTVDQAAPEPTNSNGNSATIADDDDTPPATPEAILKEFGPYVVAKEIGVKPATVKRWSKRGIPSARVDQIMKMVV